MKIFIPEWGLELPFNTVCLFYSIVAGSLKINTHKAIDYSNKSNVLIYYTQKVKYK